jgi:two-component system CheB/CheR fusion protein
VGYDRLALDVQKVLDTLTPREIEVQTLSGAWYLLRVLPYRTLENVVEGAVITFTEVTELKNAKIALREADALRRTAAVMRDASDAITVQDLQGKILAWNRGAERMYGYSESEAVKMNIHTLIPEARRDESLARVQRLAQAEVLQPYLTQRIAKNGSLVEILLTATALVDEAGTVYALSTTERAVPERVRQEHESKESTHA